jgi:polar amino acid transport system substrate-binding protein
MDQTDPLPENTLTPNKTPEVTDVIVSFDRPLKTAWQYWYPYQYLKNEAISTSLTGLDIQLIKILGKELQRKIEFQSLTWPLAIEALKKGEIDFMASATYSKEREDYVIYSDPYRYEEDSLFVLRKKGRYYKFKNVTEFIEYIKKNNFRLGVVQNVLYADQDMNAFINDEKNKKYLVFSDDQTDSLQKLLAQEIDGFLMDRIVGAAFILNTQYGEKVTEHTINMRTPIHFMFSKASVSPVTVMAFNWAIGKLKEEAVYKNIISWYLYPVILLQTVDTRWFQIIDILGTLFFSISGILIARSQKASIFAAFVYAMLPSLGGGILRDVIFSQRPVGALTTPIYLLIVCVTVLLGYFIEKIIIKIENIYSIKQGDLFYKKLYAHLQKMLVVCDAFGLASFTVIGVLITLAAKVEPLWLWGPFFSFLTGAGGTIVRDILGKNKKLADIEGEIYSEIAIVWGLFLSIGLLYYNNHIEPEIVRGLVLLTMSGTFLTRILVYYFKVPNVYFNK